MKNCFFLFECDKFPISLENQFPFIHKKKRNETRADEKVSNYFLQETKSFFLINTSKLWWNVEERVISRASNEDGILDEYHKIW
jgi:hypothetical protein